MTECLFTILAHVVGESEAGGCPTVAFVRENPTRPAATRPAWDTAMAPAATVTRVVTMSTLRGSVGVRNKFARRREKLGSKCCATVALEVSETAGADSRTSGSIRLDT